MTSRPSNAVSGGEQTRALSLYTIADPQTEQALNELLSLTADCCGVAVVCLSMPTEGRRWVHTGSHAARPALEQPEHFSEEAFKSQNLTVVDDLTTEPRLCHHPNVAGTPNFQFWAGLPLFTPEGFPLAAVHLLDFTPGHLTPSAQAMLRRLARQFQQLLEDRRSLQELQLSLNKERQTEEALRQTEEMYHDIFDNIMEGIYLSTPDGYYLSVNRMLARIYQYETPEELIAAINDIKTQLYVDPNRRNEFLRLIQDHGSVTKFESQVYRKDGSIIWISENARSVRDAKGNLLYFEGTVDDITDRRKAEEALRNSEALYHSLVESLPQHIFRKDLQGRFTFANKKFCELLGKSLEEIIGRTDFDFFPPQLAAKYQKDDRRVLEARRTFETTEENVGPNQERMFVHVVKTLLYDGKGDVIGIQGIFWDVTEHKQMEETLQRERDLHQALMDSSPDSIYFKDLNCRFIKCSKALANQVGVNDPSQAVGRSDFDLFPSEKAQEYYDEEQRIISTGQPIINKIERQETSSGKQSWASVTKFPIYNEADQITGIVGLSRDISQLKQTEAELEKARDAALESARIKSEFLANVSHEIRTPMNAIIGMTGLLLDTELNEEQEEIARTISDSAEALLTLVNDILDFSKMEAGKLTIESIQFNLRELVEGTVEIFAERAQSKDLELACLIYNDVPLSLQGDPGRLRQILINLLANALKFTTQGEVVVEVSKSAESDESVVVRFAIEDTGIGISPETMPLLFQAFTQADGSMARQYGGTGLGLAIVKQLVEMMQGRIDVESSPNQGSTFWLEIPFIKRPESEVAPLMPPFEQKRILVVDDNGKVRSILGHYLENLGLQPETVAGADAALSRLRQEAAADKPFHAVVIDLDLETPDNDGLTLARQIKADPQISEALLILLTPVGYHFSPSDLDITISATVAKPLKYQRLVTGLHRAVTGKTAPGLAQHKAARPSQQVYLPSDLKILLAEDNEVNKNVALRQLHKLGLDADTASNGVEVLERLKEHSYDVILMDCQMPEMDGYRATRQIRNLEKQASASQRTRPPYIIAMTANALTGDREKCLAVGMNDYLSKPIRQKELARVFQRAGLNVMASSGPPRDSFPKETSCAPSECDDSESPTLDPTVIDSLRELQEEDEANPIREMAELFYRDANKRIEDLDRAGVNQDSDALISEAHALKGSASNLGARRLAEICAEVEEQATQGNLSEVAELLGRLKAEYESLKQALAGAENGE